MLKFIERTIPKIDIEEHDDDVNFTNCVNEADALEMV